MQRQKSILSFFHKPSPPADGTTTTTTTTNAASASASASVLPYSYSDMLRHRPPLPAKQEEEHPGLHPIIVPDGSELVEVRGTDTPPEKLPRSLLVRGGFGGCGGRERAAQPFASIMHKFVKVEKREEVRDERRNGCNESFEAHTMDEGREVVKDQTLNGCLGSCIPTSNAPLDEENNKFLNFELDLDVLGPETPVLQPFVPRLKRIKEDIHDVNEKHSFLLSESNKRMKLIRESSRDYTCRSTSELPEKASSKFEWLNPSSIRDANRRRPGDPLYDKRTLYIPPDTLSKMSASQKQYWGVKRQYMDVVLFFKVGKFYELYELDAEIGQKELDWKMTHSGVGKCRQVGISESGIEDAVQKLLARGYKVGRMEQLETSDQAKSRGASSVIQRKLVQVYSPSTTDICVGPDAVHLLALKEGNWGKENGSTVYGFAFLDYAALKIWVGFLCDDASSTALGALMVQVSPKEVVYESQGLSKETLKAIKKYASTGSGSTQFTPTPGMDFLDASEVRNLVRSRGYFKDSFDSWTSTIDSDIHLDIALCALGKLVCHLSRLKLDDALCNGELLPYHVYKSCLKMDGQTLVNLEIFRNNVDGGPSGTLYKHLDHCITSCGKRLLRKWICNPLKCIDDINDRLNVVEGLIRNPGVSSVILEYLRRLPDLERLLGRIKASVGSVAIVLLPTIGQRVLKQQVKSFGSLIKGLRVGLELLKLLQKEENESLPFLKILNLRVLCDLDEVLNQFEATIDEVFPHYQDHDIKDSDAETLYALTDPFIGRMVEWSQVIYALSCIDVLQSFALAANIAGGSMSRPVLLSADSRSLRLCNTSTGPILKMKGLWHPYAVGDNSGSVVPNDIYLGEDSTVSHPRALLLTGPNMGGKSTLLRATCLSVILAQLGCFVPCESCVLSPVDVIFTRLGAVDRIMSGESTFFVECAETASILHNATEDSLVLLDELGRGTSTFDGYAIAYAVFRHLVEKVHCRFLFATHYHPLTKEFASHPHVCLQHMACAFKSRTSSSDTREQDLVFLYRLSPGACPESYGLQVALMAGIPREVVDAALSARDKMKMMIGKNFRSCEARSEFSSLHEECLKTLMAVSDITSGCMDEDSFDTLLCLWHEVKSLHR